jgi:hypothetical protein
MEDSSFDLDSLYNNIKTESKKTGSLNPFKGMGWKLKTVIAIVAYLIISGIIANILIIFNL